jgi:ABC-type glycerol-3-phosphate transport system substrate-binding protein
MSEADQNYISRRGFLKAVAASGATLVLAACGESATSTPVPQPTTPPEATEASQPTSPPEPTEAPQPMGLEGRFTVGTTDDLTDPEVLARSAYARNYVDFVEKYKDAQPGVEIELLQFQGGDTVDRYEALRRAAAAGAAPELAGAWAIPPQMTDSKLFVPFDPYLEEQSPYSPNAKWIDDVPGGYEALWSVHGRAPDGNTYAFLHSFHGPFQSIAFWYNRDLWEEAGAERPGVFGEQTGTWAEFMDGLAKIQAKGNAIPFWSGGASCCTILWLYQAFVLDLAYDMWTEVVDHKIDDSDISQPDGTIGLKEVAWANVTGRFNMGDDLSKASMSILKDLFGYADPDFTAPRTDDNPFLKGEAATWIWGTWQMNSVYVAEKEGEVDINWDTMWAFRVTDETHPDATGHELPCFGGTKGGKYRLDDPWVMTNTARENGNEDLCVDWLRFTSNPDAMQVWGMQQFPPGYPEGLTPAEAYDSVFDGSQYLSEPDLFPGDEYEQRLKDTMHGYYEGQIVGNNALDGLFVTTDPLTQIITAYIADELTLDDAATQLADLEKTALDDYLRQFPEWDVDNWS